MRNLPVDIRHDDLAAVCHRNGIKALSLFGSVLRADFRPDSDIDILLVFDEGRTLTLEIYADLQDEFSELFGGRTVDIVEEGRLVDPYRCHEILRTCERIYGN